MNPSSRVPAGAGTNERTLHELARSKIAFGTLPQFDGASVSAGHGPEGDCALCGRRVERHDLQYIVVQPHDGTMISRRFHIPCFLAWENVSLIDMPSKVKAEPAS